MWQPIQFLNSYKELKYDAFLGMFTNLWKATISFVMSVHLHGTTQLPLDGFSWNFMIFQKFVKKILVSLKLD